MFIDLSISGSLGVNFGGYIGGGPLYWGLWVVYLGVLYSIWWCSSNFYSGVNIAGLRWVYCIYY